MECMLKGMWWRRKNSRKVIRIQIDGAQFSTEALVSKRRPVIHNLVKMRPLMMILNLITIMSMMVKLVVRRYLKQFKVDHDLNPSVDDFFVPNGYQKTSFFTKQQIHSKYRWWKCSKCEEI